VAGQCPLTCATVASWLVRIASSQGKKLHQFVLATENCRLRRQAVRFLFSSRPQSRRPPCPRRPAFTQNRAACVRRPWAKAPPSPRRQGCCRQTLAQPPGRSRSRRQKEIQARCAGRHASAWRLTTLHLPPGSCSRGWRRRSFGGPEVLHRPRPSDTFETLLPAPPSFTPATRDTDPANPAEPPRGHNIRPKRQTH
jgi:hypothetical protein